MPTYEWQCPQCREERVSTFAHVYDEHTAPYCKKCGGMMVKDFQSMIPSVKYEENDSVTTHLTGDPIVFHSLRGLKEIAKRHGCTVDS